MCCNKLSRILKIIETPNKGENSTTKPPQGKPSEDTWDHKRAMSRAPKIPLKAASIRCFHTGPVVNKASISIVPPVHHTIRYKKNQVSTKFRDLLIPKSDVTSHRYVPQDTVPCRIKQHYENTLQSDLMLVNYRPGEQKVAARTVRPWSGLSPYHINRPPRPPIGGVSTPAIHPHTWKNVAELKSIWLSSYNPQYESHPMYVVTTTAQLQQIAAVMPKKILAHPIQNRKSGRGGTRAGAKVQIKGIRMYEVLSSLVDVVFPRMKDWRGISNKTGDGMGNISIGITAEDVRLFPEVEGNHDLWPRPTSFAITFVTTAQTDPEARVLLSSLGLIFANDKEKRD